MPSPLRLIDIMGGRDGLRFREFEQTLHNEVIQTRDELIIINFEGLEVKAVTRLNSTF